MRKLVNQIKNFSQILTLMILTVIISVNILSCENFYNEKKDDIHAIEQPELVIPQNKGAVKIAVSVPKNQNERTALPHMYPNELQDIKLTGIYDGKEYQIAKWYWYYDVENQVDPLMLEVGQWNLTLSANYRGFTFSDTKTLSVTEGSSNNISFKLSSETTTGGLQFSLYFNKDKIVHHVDYEIKKYPSGDAVTYGIGSLSPESSDEYNNYIEIIRNEDSALPSGTYRIVFKFYGSQGETLYLNTYSEIVRISGGIITEKTRWLNSLNDVYTITWHLNGGSLKNSGDSLVEYYSIHSDYTQITFPELERNGYKWGGWYTTPNPSDTDSPITEFPSNQIGDVEYWANWIEGHKLSYVIINSTNQYPISDALAEEYNLPLSHDEDADTDLTVYEITDGDTTTNLTCMFYYDADCTNPVSGGIIGASDIHDNTTIYIKPTIDHVYVSPDEGTDYDLADVDTKDNFPFNSSTPAETVEYAKEWLKNVDESLNPVLYIMSSLTEGIEDLSDLSLSSANGGLYGASIIKRYPSFTDGYLINMESGTANVTNLIIDGGADWRNSTDNTQPLADGSNVDEGINKGVTASAGLIKIQNGATLNMQNVSLRNNDCHNSSYTAKNIEIILGGVLDISQSTITRCKADLGGAIWASGKIVANTITLSYNYATTNGGAVVAANSSNIMFKQSTFLSNNAGDYGGAIYNMATDHQFYSVQNVFESNYAYSQGNIFYNKGNMTLGKETVIDGLFDNDSDIYIDNTNNYPIKFDSDFSITGTVSNIITINPYIYYSGTSSPVFDRQIFDFSTLTSISTIKSKFTLSDSNYMIDDSGYIKPLPGTITVTPGFPGTYSCGYTLTRNGSDRTINLVIKDTSSGTATVVDPSLINSLKVTLYETGDAIKTWTGTSANNFSEALEFTYPSYLDDPSDTSFYVEVSIKPTAAATVAYSYDFYAVYNTD